jgi:hypothetical protein
MARIRSIHPGIWTDEDFVEMSAHARLFLFGLWNEADDFGVLEWRPTKLKMRLAPADVIDAAGLMDEIRASGFIEKIEREGKTYAVIKNFRKWQRPKNPSAPLIEIDGEIEGIINLPKSDRSTPALPQPASTPPVIGEADGGDKMEEVGDREKVTHVARAPRVPAPIDDAVLLWNETAERAGFPIAQRMNDRRRTAIKARLAECGGLDGWKLALAKAAASDFCRGAGNSSWVIDLDAFTQAKTFTKLMEGSYDNRSQSRPASVQDQFKRAFERVDSYIDAMD